MSPPNAFLLAQATHEPDWVPLAPYADAVMVGFAMYWYLPGEPAYHINRLMVDVVQQRQG